MLAKFLFPKITFFKEKNQALGKKEKKASSCFYPLETRIVLTSKENVIHPFTVLGSTQRTDYTST